MELGILLRRHLFDRKEGIEHAEDEHRCADIERPLNGRSYVTRLYLRITEEPSGEAERQEVTDERTCVAEEGLDGISQTFLLFVDRVAYHHLKRLHGDIDTRIQEDQREDTEPDNGGETEEHFPTRLSREEITRHRQHQHHDNGDDGTDEEVRFTTTELVPCAIGKLTDQGLHDHTHQRRQKPEEGELVRVCTQRSKDTGDVSTLERISDLYSEETETQIKELCKG